MNVTLVTLLRRLRFKLVVLVSDCLMNLALGNDLG
jgi:hypothetical protein